MAGFDEQLVPRFEKDYRKEPLKVPRKALAKLMKGQTLILPARRLPGSIASAATCFGYQLVAIRNGQAPPPVRYCL
jgi:hypothetical protein